MSSGSRCEDDAEVVLASAADAAALQVLADRLFLAREAENAVVARRLHNGAGQALTAISMAAHAAMGEPDGDQRTSDLEDILDQARTALAQIRDICAQLRPAPLDAVGLAAALRWHLGRLQDDAAEKLVLEAPEPFQRPAPEVEQALFRIAEEAIANALAHAHATTVTVWLDDADGALAMEVRDDGRGFDPGSVAGPGLMEMRERARGIRARFSMAAAPGSGTRIRVHLASLRAVESAARGAAPQ